MSILQEFKKFALRGNVVDMAVGIIIGGAFGTIAKSLVDDVIMPPMGVLTGGVNFKNLSWTIKDQVTEMVGGVEKVVQPAVEINYGIFINNIITFIIVAWAVFLLVKAMNAAESRLWHEDAPDAPPPPEEVLLLREIRDGLKKSQAN
jgi:large conductance mechanosensitive channel